MSANRAQAARSTSPMDKPADNLVLTTIEPDLCSANEETDESLARSASAGDESAFEEIFERHRKRIARLVGRFFGRREKIEEIVQEVFAKTYFALGDYSAERGKSFSAWLSRIAINSCYDELRRARRRSEDSITSISDTEAAWLLEQSRAETIRSDAESTIISRDLASKLLARLAPDDRLVLTLLDAEELAVAEIAEITGWSISKVKVRAHRARAALRRILDEFI